MHLRYWDILGDLFRCLPGVILALLAVSRTLGATLERHMHWTAVCSLRGHRCALKLADAFRFPWALTNMRREAKILRALAPLQRRGIVPAFRECGSMLRGAVSYLPTEIIEGRHPEGPVSGCVAS